MSDPLQSPSLDEIRQTARSWNYDFYLAATLAPANVQSDLMALAAFAGELERIRLTVSEPALAQIRVQWWRDEVPRMMEAGTSGHPLGEALRATICNHELPVGLVIGIADAVADQLSEPQLSDAQMRDSWIGKRYGIPLTLAARCLFRDVDDVAIEAAGRAYGLSMLVSASRSGADLEAEFGVAANEHDLMDEARRAAEVLAGTVKTMSRDQRIAVLPAGLVRTYLKHATGEPGQMAKLLRMASAHWFGRF